MSRNAMGGVCGPVCYPVYESMQTSVTKVCGPMLLAL